MKPLITDEIVEKAAFAIALSVANNDKPAEAARAALLAILPDLVEACAKAMDDLPHMFDAPSGIMDAQSAIRLLKGDGK